MDGRSAPPDDDDPPLAAKVAFLSLPRSHRTAEVIVRETRTSFVFLTSDRVFKLKKPVADGDLDFRSLAARRQNASEEVRLNRRLAPDVYLGVEPLTLRADGTLGLGAPGVVADWLVVMRRLPDARFLDGLIAARLATTPAVRRLGERLARFYAAQPPVTRDADGIAARLVRGIVSTREALRDPVFGLEGARIDGIAEHQLRSLALHAREMADRLHAGVVREGHGDLRPEHVCLTDPPAIIDCLEFSEPLRLADPYDEIGYLGLECERLGAPWIGRSLWAALEQGFGHPPSEALAGFYRSYRAFVRAHFALRHLKEPDPRDPDRWRPLAAAYLKIAEEAVDTDRHVHS